MSRIQGAKVSRGIVKGLKIEYQMNAADVDTLNALKRAVGDHIQDMPEAKNSIISVYLFGSFMEKQYDSSDIDLAFLLKTDYKSDDLLEASAPAYFLAATIGRALDKETDVIILNTSSIEIAYEVISTGLCLFEADLEARLEFEVKIRGMYFDFKPFLDQLRAICLARLNPNVA